MTQQTTSGSFGKRETIRVPERKNMTVCIAAICDGGTDEQKIICCTDTLMSGALGKAQTRLKIRIASQGWGVLTAGNDSDMTTIVDILKTQFRTAVEAGTALDETSVVSLVRNALTQRKNELADEIIRGKYGVTYEYFRTKGRAEFPDDLYREALWSVRDCDLGAEFIIFGFTDLGFPTLIKTTAEGKVGIDEDFAVIGEGGYLAHTVLMHRAYNEITTLPDALYIVSEAKKYAEGAPSVGDETALIVHHRNGERSLLAMAGQAWASTLYEKYGPTPLPPKTLKLPDDAFVNLGKIKAD